MSTESAIRIFAGLFVLASVALGAEASPVFHSANWLWFTAFVGLNLFQSGFTGFCPLEKMLRKIGMKSDGAACRV
ncbi:MAG: DUF2892 domain-containing protein [Burkholderiales bacterium]